MRSKRILSWITALAVFLFLACQKKNDTIGNTPVPPVIPADIYPNPLGPTGADPGSLYDGSNFYFYFTSGNGTGAMPIKWSSDLLSFTDNGARIFPLGQFPSWVTTGNYWAPEVAFINGKYVCYYSANGSDGWFKIGVATAPAPGGPFTDKGAPLASNTSYSLIDPSFFRDTVTGKNYILWKNNTNALTPPQPTRIVLQELSVDGLNLVGSPTNLLVNDLTWEAAVIEAPSMLYYKGYYYIFYSGNNYGTDKYAIGVARSNAIGGPYTKMPDPILQSDTRFDGPGGQSIVTNSSIGPYLMFYHARVRTNPSARVLMMDKITWRADNWPIVNDGTPSD